MVKLRVKSLTRHWSPLICAYQAVRGPSHQPQNSTSGWDFQQKRPVTYTPQPGDGQLKPVMLLQGHGIGRLLTEAVQEVIHAIIAPVFFEGGGVSFLNIQLRKKLDLFATLVHCFSLPGLTSRHEEVDIVVILGNTEGEYSGPEHEVVPGVVESIKVCVDPCLLAKGLVIDRRLWVEIYFMQRRWSSGSPISIAVGVKMISWKPHIFRNWIRLLFCASPCLPWRIELGWMMYRLWLSPHLVPASSEFDMGSSKCRSERVAKYAFEYAFLNGRKTVTEVHRAYIMNLADGLFVESCRDVAKKYPSITYNEVIIENCCKQLASNPQQFDVLVAPNLYGTLVANIAAGVAGGTGVMPECNVGPRHAIFEPGVSAGNGGNENPVLQKTAIPARSFANFCHASAPHEFPYFADRLERAVKGVIAEGKHRTRDSGGSSSTQGFGSLVAEFVPICTGRLVKTLVGVSLSALSGRLANFRCTPVLFDVCLQRFEESPRRYPMCLR